jgi:hypothetical protein
LGLAWCFGNIGSTNPQNSSVTNGLDIVSSVKAVEQTLNWRATETGYFRSSYYHSFHAEREGERL